MPVKYGFFREKYVCIFLYKIDTHIYIYKVFTPINIWTHILFIWIYLKDWINLILRFIKLIIKNALLSISMLSITEKIISQKYNTYIKYMI
jgi:hypothetical protein